MTMKARCPTVERGRSTLPKTGYVVTRSRPYRAEGRDGGLGEPALPKEKDSTWCCPYLRYSGCDVIASLPFA